MEKNETTNKVIEKMVKETPIDVELGGVRH